jgi:polyisoprenoid-binding protein YceI
MRKLYVPALLLTFTLAAAAADMDPAASKVTIHVEKSGLFAAFAHNHIVSAPLASGRLDPDQRTVELKFHTADLKVLDPGSSASEREKIQSTMQSSEVLDPAKFPEISFASTSVESPSGNRYLAHGNLTLHGVTKPVDVPVSFANGHYTGKVTIKQTEFGITPVRIAGGAVRVKDPITIEFDIVTAN